LVGAGVAGGYAVSRDAVTNHFDLPAAHVFSRSLAAVEALG